MEPNYRPGNLVVGIKSKKINIDDIVIVQHKSLGKIIKRVKSINENGIELQSDNKKYGSIAVNELHSPESIIGKVYFKIWILKPHTLLMFAVFLTSWLLNSSPINKKKIEIMLT